jgi:Lipase (class 3)
MHFRSLWRYKEGGSQESLGVHGGMWTALHSQQKSAAEQVRDKLRDELSSESNAGLQKVLCGHSRGGAYAILCGLELLHMGMKIDAIVAHGAPQVIIPNVRYELWCYLGNITTIYVNGSDVVPRLPSCHEDWKETVENMLRMKRTKFGFEISIDNYLIVVWEMLWRMGNFRHVGKLTFIQMVKDGQTECQLVDANGEGSEGWDILNDLPKCSGDFIIDHHIMYQYVLEAARW